MLLNTLGDIAVSMNIGKCPKCAATVARLAIERIDITEKHTPEWRGISLVCPSCSTVLGAAIDPVDLKNFVVEEVVHKLRSVQ
jgi:hypothetical protein